MKQTVYLSDFRTSFARMDRKDQFSYEALELIFDYIQEYEQSTGEEYELDVIGLCCEWSELDYKDVFNTYPIECDQENPSDDNLLQAALDYLNDETQIAGVTSTGSIVYVQF